ncbi:ORF6N domain-containing protein [Rhodoferax sp.]|uniref:ORF6N domain-containing protein n=1 Tax=Rhodoferax sp. TaxID=50421 RepID=UPI00341C9AD5
MLSQILQGDTALYRQSDDLADLYGMPTKALNQAVKRNLQRFPPDLMFQLNASEKAKIVTNTTAADF